MQHKLTLMRNKEASTNSFRRLLNELSSPHGLQSLPRHAAAGRADRNPLETMTAKVIDGKKLVFVSILRAGNGSGRCAVGGAWRTRGPHRSRAWRPPKTLQAEYYFKMPKSMEERDIVVVDPMLATGNQPLPPSPRLKACKPRSIVPVPAGPAPKASPPCTQRTWMCPSTPPPWTASSTTTATSRRAWGTRATGFGTQ